MTANPDTTGSEHWFKKLRRQPVFPVLVFILLASIIKENYPFSHFSMYSNPSKEVRYAFLTDENGEPLSILYHTGLSTSKVSKTLNKERGPLEDIAKEEGKDPDTGESKKEIDRIAGENVLQAIRDLSMKRRKRELTGEIKLFETTVTVRKGELVQEVNPIATLPPVTDGTPES